MSSQGHHKMSALPPKQHRSNEIDLTERFSEQMAQLCMNNDYSDVEFVVENQRLPAHRVILAARSEYFRALLFGGLAETTQREIHLKVPLEAFKALLRYIYSGHMPLSQICEDIVLDILGLVNQYGFTELEEAISEYLRGCLTLKSVCNVLDAARLYNLVNLTEVCLNYIDRNAVDIMQHEAFLQLSKESLEEVLRRDSFFGPEEKIFLAVWEWSKTNPEVDIESVVACIRLPLIDLEHLLHVVRQSGLLDPNKLLDAIEEQSLSHYLPYRAALWPEKNVASAKFMSRTIQGECRNALLDGDFITYDMEKGYTRHCITENNDSCIMVELGHICLINHIQMLLWDRDGRAYSYYIEVSVNQSHWKRVIDHTQYHCRSWQFLYFEAHPVRYIKLVGTRNTVNTVFHVVGLEAMYTANIPKLVNGIVQPKANVATIEMSAVVVNGVSRTRNCLLNGDYDHYDWDFGYTCHQLCSGDIVVRLGQPYYLGSMRLLLWDLDNRTYSFYIETSVNEQDWQIVVDKRNEQVKSWQNCAFTPRPVVFIRIVGTQNTANEIFHIVHLECPSQDLKFLEAEKKNESQGSSSDQNKAISGETAAKTVQGSTENSSTESSSSNNSSGNNSSQAHQPIAANPVDKEEECLVRLDENSLD